jgi:alkaline phosphatase D
MKGKIAMPSEFEIRGRLNRLAFFAALFCFQALFAQKLTHGPFAGGVTSDSARFYVRVDTAARVNIQLSTTENFAQVISGNEQAAAAANDFTGLIRVGNLAAETLYYYRAIVNGAPTGEIRQFRTFPPQGSRAPFLFTFGSCQQNQPWQGVPDAGRAFTVMARDLPRFFLQIGDWGYPDTTDTAKDSTNFFNVEMSRVQASYRAKFDSTYPLQHVLRIAPIDYVYDDHDYMNNNASAFTVSDARRAREIPAPPQARLNSIKGYQQLFPGYSLANSSGGIWHKFTCGNADFFMLDTRSQRSPNMNALRRHPSTGKFEFIPDNRRHSILAGDSTLVGENQRDWLLRELHASPADWKFIITSVPFNRGLRRALDMALAAQDSSVLVPGFGTVTGLFVAIEMLDKWVGFEQDQDLLLQFLRTNEIKNVIMLSGDLHTAAIDDGANAGLPEIMAGGLDISNSMIVAVLELLGLRIWNRGGQTTLVNGNFNDAYGRINVFGADSVRLEVVDEFGEVLARHTVLDGSLPTGIADGGANRVAYFTLSPNYPNPLHATAVASQTTLHYVLPARAAVTATIYDVLGRRVRQLRRQMEEAGEHNLIWDGKNDHGVSLSSGIYFLSMQLVFPNGQRQIARQKIALIK